MENIDTPFKLVLCGLDTVECAYFLKADENAILNYIDLAVRKAEIRNTRFKEERKVTIGGIDFLLAPNGTKSGYPFLISNRDFTIQFGEFNNPSFFVKYSSEALWRDGVEALHHKFLSWATSLGFTPTRDESLSRADHAFDYSLPIVDFDEDSFLTESVIDAKYRRNKKAQTFDFGRGDVKFRMYDKSAEIKDKSGKVWFHDLWKGQKENIWRIEWQVRKENLRKYCIRTIDDLTKHGPILLKYLSYRDSLRLPSNDTNHSRWPLHPLWVDLRRNIDLMECLPPQFYEDENKSLHHRKIQMVISLYGYFKSMAATEQVLTDGNMLNPGEVLQIIEREMKKLHDPMTWKDQVQKRVDKIKAGKW